MGFKRESERPSVEAEAFQGQRWEYRARNLKKVPGMGLERDFNEHGAAGWEFVAVADGYAVFKRPVASVPSELEAAT
jgi:hypothetical protein